MTEQEFTEGLRRFEMSGNLEQQPRKKAGVPESTDTSEVHRGKTPNGGDYSVAYFFDKDEQPCKREAAKRINIVEYTLDGIRVNECYVSV